MTTYVLRKGKLVPKHLASPAPSAGLFVQSDNLGGMLLHPITGKHTDSKSRFRQMTRDTGAVEIGTEPIRPRQFQKRGEDPRITIKRMLES